MYGGWAGLRYEVGISVLLLKHVKQKKHNNCGLHHFLDSYKIMSLKLWLFWFWNSVVLLVDIRYYVVVVGFRKILSVAMSWVAFGLKP